MPARLVRHVRKHPWRLSLALMGCVLFSWAFAGYGLVNNFDVAHEGRMENCRAINELSRKIYVTLADFGIKQGDPRREKFVPTLNCETLP